MYHVLKPQISEYSHHTCAFHERHPGATFPGCTCSSSFGSRDKPESEWTEQERKSYYAALRVENVDGTPIFK